jgi:hypothetical protein
MLKKGAIAILSLAVTGCALDRGTENWDNTGDDWANNCNRNFSEDSRAYTECVERVSELNFDENGQPIAQAEDFDKGPNRPVQHSLGTFPSSRTTISEATEDVYELPRSKDDEPDESNLN